MTIHVAAYWPFLQRGEARRFHYTSIDGSQEPFTSVFWLDPMQNTMVLVDLDEDNVWKDTWYYRYDPGVGVAEWRDDIPLGGWLSKIFGPVNRVVYSAPILWGNFQEIGSYSISFPKKDPFKSWPPSWEQGKQVVLFEDHLASFTTAHGDTFDDVLLFQYLQQWGDKVAGARYWAAREIGPIAVEFFGVPPSDLTWLGVDHSRINFIRTARYDAKVFGAGLV